MSFSPKTFGKYTLLEKIASGGMAEIYMARTVGPGGFEKIVALKCILPQFSANDEFISMFIDEAKTTSQLSHSNIVQIYEFGETDGRYYLAMEFIDGKNLRQILAKCEELKRPIPLEHAVYMASKICEGLDYAHRFHDKRQQTSLQIIHRDISPQNILLSFEGEVKLIDFGIAKTRSKNDHTKSGILKGKFGYMSPEQAHGETVDQRTDIFSTGIILYEMLTRQRLFQSSNDLQSLKKIQEAKIPSPSLFNPDIPFELEEILLKTLERNRDKRYQTARQLHRDLSRFLNTLNPDFTTRHSSTFVKSLFALEILEHKKKMHALLISLATTEEPSEFKHIPHLASSKNSDETTQGNPRTLSSTITDIKKPARDSQPSTMPSYRPQPPEEEEPYSPKRVWMQVAVMGLAVITLSMVLLVLNENPDRIIQSTLDEVKKEHSQKIDRQPNVAPPVKPKLHTPTTSVLRIVTEPEGADIFIDKKLIGQTPLTIPHLPQHKKIQFRIERSGYKTVQETISLTTSQQNIKKNLIPVGVGYLHIRPVIDSDIEIDGKRIGAAPISAHPLTTGKHRIRAISKEGLIAETVVNIKKDETELLDEQDLQFRPAERMPSQSH